MELHEGGVGRRDVVRPPLALRVILGAAEFDLNVDAVGLAGLELGHDL